MVLGAELQPETKVKVKASPSKLPSCPLRAAALLAWPGFTAL